MDTQRSVKTCVSCQKPGNGLDVFSTKNYPQFVHSHNLSVYQFKSYLAFLRPIFFWDTLYIYTILGLFYSFIFFHTLCLVLVPIRTLVNPDNHGYTQFRYFASTKFIDSYHIQFFSELLVALVVILFQSFTYRFPT